MFLLNDANILVLGGTTGLQKVQDYAKATYNLGEGKTGWVAQHDRSMRLIDRPHPEELAAYEGAADAFKYVENIPQTEFREMGFVAVPIRAKNKVAGVIRAAIGREDDLDFSPFDQDILEQIARQVGLALEAEEVRHRPMELL